ncbi:MAG: response regulator [Treponema sp.]|nr:response regulator [Treponema sp.]
MIDKSLLTADFIEETKEHSAAIHNDIIKLHETPENEELMKDLLRELHTIKGTSRMLGYMTLEKLSHGLEDVLKAISEKRLEITGVIVGLTLLTLDMIDSCLVKVKENLDDTCTIDHFLKAYASVLAGGSFERQGLQDEIDGISGLNDNSKEKEISVDDVQSIRIKLETINNIINDYDGLIIREFKLKRVLDLLQQEEIETKNPRLGTIRKNFESDLEQLEMRLFDVQNSIFNLRMLPLSIILDPLRRTIENDALSFGKKVRFDIPTNNITLDKVILEQLSDILLHLLRNSLDHGIESAEEREKLGKDPTGTIRLSTTSTANHLEMVIEDDGRGINYDKVRQKAINHYPDRESEIMAMSENDLSSFLFISGFSTNETVTALSGRGVGLDVVRTNMEKIKGKITFTTEKSKGTKFVLSFPSSLASLQGMFVTSGGMKFLIPAQYISEVTQIDENDYISLQNQNLYRLRESLIPIYNLSSILKNIKPRNEKRSKIVKTIIVEYLGKKTGIIVDDLQNYVSLVVKPLPDLLKNITALQGVVFDENYSIVPILNMPTILTMLKSLLNYDLQKFEVKTQQKEYSILIVDDSYTTRQIEQTILSMEDYLVDTAVDGIDALDKMKNKKYDVIVTDIKMPRMDGCVLIENIRRQELNKNTPVIVISSVYEQETRERFMSAGANAFIVKSDFERGNLLSTVKELIHE